MFSVYQSSNFFLRGALPEFFAICLLNIIVGVWILAIYSQNKLSYWILIAIGMLAIFDMHPITAMCGSLFLVVLIIFTLRQMLLGVDKIKYFIIAGILILLVAIGIMPFLYRQVFQEPFISSRQGSLYYFENIDSFFARISFIPFDKNAYRIGIGTSDYNVSAAINMILYCLNFYLSIENVRNRSISFEKKCKIILINFTIILLVGISLIPFLGRLLPEIFKLIQFPYRLVGYIDLCIMCSIFLNLGIWINKEELEYRLKVICIVSVVILLQILVVRYYQIRACGDIVSLTGEEVERTMVGEFTPIEVGYGKEPYELGNPIYMPATYYDESAYKVISEYKNVDMVDIQEIGRVAFNVEIDPFGEVENIRIDVRNNGYLGIYMYPHPWNHIYLDGELYPNSEIVYDSKFIDNNVPIYIWIENPGIHTIEYKFEPPEIYQTLQYVKKVIYYVLISMFFISMTGCLKKVFFRKFNSMMLG